MVQINLVISFNYSNFVCTLYMTSKLKWSLIDIEGRSDYPKSGLTILIKLSVTDGTIKV